MRGLGDGPPAGRKLTIRIERRLIQRVVRTETDERIQTQACGFNRRRQRVCQIVWIEPVEGARSNVSPDHPADRRSIGSIAERPERVSRASLNDGVGVGERHGERRACRGVADQAKRERRHLPDLRLFIREEFRERFDGITEPHAAKGKGGATPDARFCITEQANQIRWRRGCDDLGRPCRRRHEDHRRRRIRIAEDALILEPHHPSEFFFPRHGDWSRRQRRRRNGRARAHQRKAHGTGGTRNATSP